MLFADAIFSCSDILLICFLAGDSVFLFNLKIEVCAVIVEDTCPAWDYLAAELVKFGLDRIDANWQRVIKGLVLLAAVVFEILNNKDKTKD